MHSSLLFFFFLKGEKMTPEGKFKSSLIAEIERRFPGAIVLKNDANFLQGIPDQLILYRDRWAAFEAKASIGARRQRNQPYYIRLLNEMSFARFVSPETAEEFLDDLQTAFRS
jgi:hypothetical protein